MTEFKRHFTKTEQRAVEAFKWRRLRWRDAEIEAPADWSDNAMEIAASKYFRHNDGETSVRQLMNRVVQAIRESGEQQGYFSAEQAEIFAEELMHVLLAQIGSFNSPVYFNVGVFPAYHRAGTGENFLWDEKARRAVPLSTGYVHPQASACFIQDVQDDLLGIFELLKAEAKLFKYGSGTGTNFSKLRAKGEPLDGGGESTGLISYLEIFDKAAGAIKSGGTTRRAAKMVVLDADHPEILDFVHWKMNEERKARLLLANGYSGGMEGEAFRTVSGQNSNNSVRVTDAFLHAATNGGGWQLKYRRSGKIVRELKAEEILHQMARAAWECADPGIQFHDTIQKWHMCPNSGEIRSSNPCSEYMFLDNSACNLASLNLVKFLQAGRFDWESFAQAAQILLVAQDILVDYAAYPTAAIAENSHRFRPLGLGYANLGGLLMRLGVPYDSELGAEWTRKITGAMHAMALNTSQRLAKKMGAFSGWDENREPALDVLGHHTRAWKELGFKDMKWVEDLFNSTIAGATHTGLRNAQVTLIAPTGTIGLLMDCDTLGIEPDFSLIKRKTLAGGGEMVIVNTAVNEALTALRYSPEQVESIAAFVKQHGRIVGAPGLKPEHAPIFDCALAPPQHPERRVTPEGHLRIMAAAQPFLSGAISKTVNLPSTFTVQEVRDLFLQAWRLGLKALAIYRDSSKALQPLCAEC